MTPIFGGAALAAVLALAPLALAAGPVGTADQVQGVATAVRDGAKIALTQGAAVHDGDELSTSADGKLVVAFADGTRLTLGPAADVVVDEYVYSPDGGANRQTLKVAAGAVRFVSGAMERIGGPQSIRVETPVATIGIRGTDFFIEQTPARLSVALFSGRNVGVSNAAGTTVLRPGEGTDVFGALAPTPARPWAADRINRALGLTTASVPSDRPMPYSRAPAAADTMQQALGAGRFSADLRLRSEWVEQAGMPRTGEATTARLRLGYETLAVNGFSAGVSGQITRNLARPARNDGVNGRTDLPLIPDPAAEQLHELYGAWTQARADGMAGHRLVLGRQRLQFENERWIGASDFRQNAQSFDAVTAELRPAERWLARYTYVSRVNRVLGNNPGGHWTSDSHLAGVITTALPFGVTTGYAYILDLRAVPRLSTATVGVRYDGKIPTGPLELTLEAEWARQRDHARNPVDFALSYFTLKPGLIWRDTTLSVGWEELRGNGRVAVQTPLATLHRHNGWADVFNTTPPTGLRDLQIRWMQEFPPLGPFKMPKLDLRFHDFASAGAPGRRIAYGHEWNADANASILNLFTVGVRFARYEARGFARDTTKVWTYVEFRY